MSMVDFINTVNRFIAFIIRIHVAIGLLSVVLAIWLLITIIRHLK